MNKIHHDAEYFKRLQVNHQLNHSFIQLVGRPFASISICQRAGDMSGEKLYTSVVCFGEKYCFMASACRLANEYSRSISTSDDSVLRVTDETFFKKHRTESIKQNNAS